MPHFSIHAVQPRIWVSKKACMRPCVAQGRPVKVLRKLLITATNWAGVSNRWCRAIQDASRPKNWSTSWQVTVRLVRLHSVCSGIDVWMQEEIQHACESAADMTDNPQSHTCMHMALMHTQHANTHTHKHTHKCLSQDKHQIIMKLDVLMCMALPQKKNITSAGLTMLLDVIKLRNLNRLLFLF